MTRLWRELKFACWLGCLAVAAACWAVAAACETLKHLLRIK